MNLVKSPAKLPQFYTPGITPLPDRRHASLARPVALIHTADGRLLVNSAVANDTATTTHSAGYYYYYNARLTALFPRLPG